MTRKKITTTLDEDLYQLIQILAIHKKIAANDLIEEGMKMVIEKYKDKEV